MKAKGVVYILTNPSFRDDQLKIGMSRRSGDIRAEELYSKATGIPTPFKVAFQKSVANCIVAEELIHKKLAGFRTNKNREFFNLPLEDAIALLTEIVKKVNSLYLEYTPDVKIKTSEEKSSIKLFGQKLGGQSRDIKQGNNDYIGVKNITVRCDGCKTSFEQTLTRYEFQAACPACYKVSNLDVIW